VSATAGVCDGRTGAFARACAHRRASFRRWESHRCWDARFPATSHPRVGLVCWNSQLHRWILLPLVIFAVPAHCLRQGGPDFGFKCISVARDSRAMQMPVREPALEYKPEEKPMN
jgi:hypothetical protein